MGALTHEPDVLAGLRVGVYGSGGAPWPHAAFAALFGARVRTVRAEDVAAGRLDELDVLIVPGGGRVAMHGLLAPLGRDGVATIRRWVEDGGTYLSSCAGSVLPLALEGAAAELLPATAELRLSTARLANPGDATLGGLASPGVGVIRVTVDSTSPLARGVPSDVELIHYNGPFFALDEEDDRTTSFARPIEATEGFTPAERFLPRGETEVGTTFDRCVARGAAGAVVAEVGRGRAVLFGSHPEFGFGPLLLGWGEGAALLRNALADAPRAGGDVAGDGPWRRDPARTGRTPAELADAVASAFERVAVGFARLQAHDDAAWLEGDASPTFLGTGPRVAWRRDRVAAETVAREVAASWREAAAVASDADLPWLDDRPRPDQDVGAMGLLQLAEQAEDALAAAERGASDGPEPLAHAYDGLDQHPFHLAVGSYLSAAGLVAGAALQTATAAALQGRPLGPLGRRLFATESTEAG